MATIKAPADKATSKKVSKQSTDAVAVKAKKTASAETKTSTPKSSKSSKKNTAPLAITSEARTQMIAEAAYYLAEKHHFSDSAQSYWLAAEQQIHASLTA